LVALSGEVSGLSAPSDAAIIPARAAWRESRLSTAGAVLTRLARTGHPTLAAKADPATRDARADRDRHRVAHPPADSDPARHSGEDAERVAREAMVLVDAPRRMERHVATASRPAAATSAVAASSLIAVDAGRGAGGRIADGSVPPPSHTHTYILVARRLATLLCQYIIH
jgi:hypothetical protein